MKLPNLGAHADPKHSQTYFAQFKRKFNDVLQLTRETEKFLRLDDKGELRGTTTRWANKAVYSLLKAYSSTDIANLLSQLPDQKGTTAYKVIERRLCPTDPQAQRQSYTTLVSLQIDPGETVKNFNKKFNRAVT